MGLNKLNELDALKLRLSEKLAAEHRDHPFAPSTAEQVATARAARWEAITNESWHAYQPTEATRARREAEIYRELTQA